MLEVPTYLGRSEIHGIGLFAARPIPKGTRTWSYHPEIDIEFSSTKWRRLLRSLHPMSARQIAAYAYKARNRFYLCTDGAQFMNHSDTPNILQHRSEDIMLAGEDIPARTELTCNYFDYSDPDDPVLEALSGSPVDERIRRRYSAAGRTR